MKSITYLLMFGVFCQLLFLSSCDKDDDVNPIVGTWTLYSEVAVDCDDPLDDYSDTYTCTATDCIKVTFTSDGKLKTESKDGGTTITIDGTYTIADNKLTICTTSFGCEDPMNYTISGGTLTTTDVDDLGCSNTTILKK